MILEQAHVRGASISLIRGGNIEWTGSFGTTDERTGERVHPGSVFEAASLGKVIAAYAALLLVDEGRWSLSMPATSPRLMTEPGCELPVLGQLLSHTAGLGNDLTAKRYHGACHPPSPFSYAGQGYLVLQDLLEAREGMPAEDFIRDRVFRPLGMNHSTFAESEAEDRVSGHADLVYGVFSGRVKGPLRWSALSVLVVIGALLVALSRHTWKRDRAERALCKIAIEWIVAVVVLLAAGCLIIAPLTQRVVPVSLASSLTSNVDDLGRFIQEILRPRLVSVATRDLLFAPEIQVDTQISWGAGIGIDRSTPLTTYWQWGSNPGFQSLLVIEPERGDAIVILTNTGGSLDRLTERGSGYSAAKQIARHALGINGRWDLYRPAPGNSPISRAASYMLSGS